MKRILSLLVLLFIFSSVFSQIQIDWQQCYGSFSRDYARRIAKKEDGYFVTGTVHEESGMVTLPVSNLSWIIDIDETGNLRKEFGLGHYARHWEDFFANYNGVYYYAIGLPPNEFGKEQLGIKKINANGDVLWERLFGDKNKAFWDFTRGVGTLDGGVIASTTTQWSGGDISNYYGMDDAWVVKIDSLGNLEWETTLGTDGDEVASSFTSASDGGCYVAMAGCPGYIGSIPICQIPSTDEYDCIFTKLDANGNLLWSHCYGGSKHDGVNNVLEFEEGFLLVGNTESDDRDVEGAGYHLGHLNNLSYNRQTTDTWLIRTDADGNIIWSRCYGGTGDEFPTKAFQNEDGGFTVFGTTASIDGDAQSAEVLYMPIAGQLPASLLWVFRTDADGNLLWERAIGHKSTGNPIYLDDVVKLSDSEYTILGTSHVITDPYFAGDYNCSNGNLCHNLSYWVLHITDIFNYDDPTGIEEQPKVVPFTAKVYPNPTQGLLTVSGTGIKQVRLYNMLGQQVAAASSYNGSNVMLSTIGLDAGIYMVQVLAENGSCVKRVVVGEAH